MSYKLKNKWIEIREDFFNSKKFNQIRKKPQGESVIIVYLKLQIARTNFLISLSFLLKLKEDFYV